MKRLNGAGYSSRILERGMKHEAEDLKTATGDETFFEGKGLLGVFYVNGTVCP